MAFKDESRSIPRGGILVTEIRAVAVVFQTQLVSRFKPISPRTASPSMKTKLISAESRRPIVTLYSFQQLKGTPMCVADSITDMSDSASPSPIFVLRRKRTNVACSNCRRRKIKESLLSCIIAECFLTCVIYLVHGVW